MAFQGLNHRKLRPNSKCNMSIHHAKPSKRISTEDKCI
ncbi:hypothetical protein COLO4_06032 [Corchorus olitorius]|uniref:Uncharacterized protein n=1 Tax=Corchorus olitorius TaxID=93759 RepID=A0A1R3KP78_9ROSI|nr:hypothetical protein COLO4_06032 [Corchorus olitorius]